MCFGNVRVVVPCGDGDILVRDLIREATLRYKKATGKVSFVCIESLWLCFVLVANEDRLRSKVVAKLFALLIFPFS